MAFTAEEGGGSSFSLGREGEGKTETREEREERRRSRPGREEAARVWRGRRV